MLNHLNAFLFYPLVTEYWLSKLIRNVTQVVGVGLLIALACFYKPPTVPPDEHVPAEPIVGAMLNLKGATNCADRIETALAETHGGQVVLLPPGTFRLEHTLYLSPVPGGNCLMGWPKIRRKMWFAPYHCWVVAGGADDTILAISPGHSVARVSGSGRFKFSDLFFLGTTGKYSFLDISE